MRFFILPAILVLFCSATAAADRPPRAFTPPPAAKSATDLSLPLIFKQGGDTVWLYVGQPATQTPEYGGAHSGGPSEEETFTFEPGLASVPDEQSRHKRSAGSRALPGQFCGGDGSPYFADRCFTTVDVRTFPAPDDRFYWHVDNYNAYSGFCWWCGTSTGTACEDWDNAPGYGSDWDQYLVLDPDLPGFSSGDTLRLSCRVRYDTECDYDYAYIQYSEDQGNTWATMAVFNGTSGSSSGSPCGSDYFGNDDLNQGAPSWQYFPTNPGDGEIIVTAPDSFLVAFKFESDGAWSDEDGEGDTDGAFFIDSVLLESMSFGGGVLEVEDMDTNFEPQKWQCLRPRGVADFWDIHEDPDPPFEPSDPGGPSICAANGSWQWAAAPFVDGAWRIPTDANGFFYRLVSPSIYVGWGEPTVPVEYASVVCQADVFPCVAEFTCDILSTRVRGYDPGREAWCGWETTWSSESMYTGCDYFWIDSSSDACHWIDPDADSIQFCWDVMDAGQTGDYCWTTVNPKPHKKTQLIVDNVSFGLYDQSGTHFTAREIDLFQDSFDLETDAHNALLANGDMPKAYIARAESLTVDIHDMNGLDGVDAWVRLYYSDDGGGSWGYNDMVCVIPDQNNPELGGTYCGSIAACEVPSSGGPLWTPGTEIWYYIAVKDNLNNIAYWPDTANPLSDPPARPYFNNYFEFSILPGINLCGAPHRILLVDDFGRTDYDFHPCMEESTLWETEDFYESTLYDLGFCFDKYDVNGASTGLSNQPWGIVMHPDPANPDSAARWYDMVIWFSSRFDQYTVGDTMCCRLFDFVRKGGHLFMAGNNIGVDMTDYGSYSDDAADTCDFYGGIIGAKMEPPGESSPGIQDPDHYAKGTGNGGSLLGASDIFHFYIGCPLSVTHDLTEVNDEAPTWSHPQPYLEYEVDPGDGTVVGIVNYYDDLAGEVGGKVVHLGFDLTACVDSCEVTCDRTYKGRYEIMEDVLLNVFSVLPIVAIPPETEKDGIDALAQNRPNPFNPDTDIDFSVVGPSRVNLAVYDVQGRRVKTLVDEVLDCGDHRAHWDGTDEHGQPVATGIYFCRMQAGDFRATRKMVMLK